MMRRAITMVAGTLCLALGAAAPVGAQQLAARVNSAGIHKDRLEASVNAYLNRQGANYQFMTHPNQYKAVRSQVLDVLIGQELLWQEARTQNLVLNPEAVEQALAQAKRRFKSEQEFRLQIQQDGFTEATYAEDLKRQLSVRRLVQEAIAPEVTVPDQDIDAFYAANADKMQRPAQVHVRHILITLEPGADEAAQQAAQATIDGILAEARAGADFAALARTHSQGPSAQNGGDLGFVARRQLVKPFADAAFALEPGEISEVVRTRFGYHIIRLETRRDSELAPKQEVAGQIRQHLYSAKVQQKVQQLVQQLRDKAQVEILEPR
ncbi:MAG: peptidylprolyl isomerase [Planctomycetota bacterium]|jgi:parvulin-like peptidyl-prolyl isomerase